MTAWADPAGFRRLPVAASETAFLRLHDPDAVDEFIARFNAYSVGTQGWIDTRDDALAVYEIFGVFLGAFGIFVMIAAAVVVAGSMATWALSRRRDLGLLKAVGVTPRQVAATIVLPHVLAAAAGVGGGWVLGGFLAPLTQVDLGATLGTGGTAFSRRGLLVALAAVEVIVVAAALLPAWRAGRPPTAEALAFVPAHRGRGGLLRRATARLHLGPVPLAAVRDATSRPARSALTALALALALVAVLASIGAQRTVDRIFADGTLVGNPEELRVYPAGAAGAAAEAIPGVLARQAGVAS